MPGSQTTPGPVSARNNAPAGVAFRKVNDVGTRIDNAFAAQWLACTLPYRRFAVVLAGDHARIGADVGCYSFIAVDFHHILLAGLPAHSLTLRPARRSCLRLVHVVTSVDPRLDFRWGGSCPFPVRESHPLEASGLS